MSFLDNLLNRNPTKDWQPQPGLQLVLDLDEESFCGIRLGERADRLQKFGPAEDAAKARIARYEYTTRGFLCDEEQGRFVEVALWYQAALEGQAFQGTVRRNGTSVTWTPATVEADVVALLGPPDEREDDPATDDASSGAELTWKLNRTDLMVEFVDGKLDNVWLGTKT